MTVFGTTLEGAQIAALVGLLATLALWIIVLGRERGYARWFRQWEGDRKARLEAEQAEAPPKREPTGPWG
jgi:hypothetical protein